MKEEKLREEYIEFKKNIFDFFIHLEKISSALESFSNKSGTQEALEDQKEIIQYLQNWQGLKDFSTIFQNTELENKLKEIKQPLEYICKNDTHHIHYPNNPPVKSSEYVLSFYDSLMHAYNNLRNYKQEKINSFQSFFHEDIEILKFYQENLKLHLSIIQPLSILKQQIQEAHKLISDSKNLKKNNEKQQQNIDRLMADATKLGLAQRYTQEKKNNNFAKWFWTILVGLGLYGLFFLSDLSNTISQNLNKTAQWGQNTQKQIQNPPQSLGNYALNFLKKSPAYLALVWFILFASRRRNEANRLASDYAHKEVFASSYIAYQDEIKKLKEKNPNKKEELTELNTKLLDSMIGVLSDNPAKSLDAKKTTDELPTKELINFASEVIKLKK